MIELYVVTESNTNDAPEKSAFALLGVMMPPFGAKANIGVLVEKSNPMTAGTMAAFWMENDSFVLMKKACWWLRAFFKAECYRYCRGLKIGEKP